MNAEQKVTNLAMYNTNEPGKYDKRKKPDSESHAQDSIDWTYLELSRKYMVFWWLNCGKEEKSKKKGGGDREGGGFLDWTNEKQKWVLELGSSFWNALLDILVARLNRKPNTDLEQSQHDSVGLSTDVGLKLRS